MWLVFCNSTRLTFYRPLVNSNRCRSYRNILNTIVIAFYKTVASLILKNNTHSIIFFSGVLGQSFRFIKHVVLRYRRTRLSVCGSLVQFPIQYSMLWLSTLSVCMLVSPHIWVYNTLLCLKKDKAVGRIPLLCRLSRCYVSCWVLSSLPFFQSHSVCSML